MHAAIAMVQKIVRPVSAQLDLRNARNVLSAVQALIRGRRLTLMELARHWPDAERVLAPLKRLDRLLGNTDVQALRWRFYAVAAAWVVRSAQPVLVVDWSEATSNGRWYLLRAGIVARGRTITVYEEVHPESKKGSRRVEGAFLKHLQALLPAGVQPVIVTDAGFRNPWFKAVEELGWHWIGRIGWRIRVRLQGDTHWALSRELYVQASTSARSLGQAQVALSNALSCWLVLVRRHKRGRVELTRFGKRARSAHSRKMAARAKQPWLLAVSHSLSAHSAAEIASLYGKRMQIEQAFRDLKSHRYGCAFEDTLTRSAQRLEMLLLIHMLATLVAWLVALANSEYMAARVCIPSLAKRYSALWIGWTYLRHASTLASGPPLTMPAALTELLAAPS